MRLWFELKVSLLSHLSLLPPHHIACFPLFSLQGYEALSLDALSKPGFRAVVESDLAAICAGCVPLVTFILSLLFGLSNLRAVHIERQGQRYCCFFFSILTFL